jgi:hypothetical protein
MILYRRAAFTWNSHLRNEPRTKLTWPLGCGDYSPEGDVRSVNRAGSPGMRLSALGNSVRPALLSSSFAVTHSDRTPKPARETKI